MRLIHKLLLATILPAVLIWIVGIYATTASRSSLRDEIENTSLTRTRAIMDEIDRIVQTHVADWKAYSRSELVQQTLMESNAEFAQDENAKQTIAEQDELWQQTPQGETTPLMRKLLDNRLSRDLRVRLEKLHEGSEYPVFGEVFFTNRYGANAAQTNRTSDYRQDDEDWWQRAMGDGVYISNVTFDESAGISSIEICLEVDDDGGEPLGAVKAVMNIQEVLSVIDQRAVRLGRNQRLMLLSSDGTLIHQANSDSQPNSGESYLEGVKFETPELTQRIDDQNGNPLLRTYAKSQGYADFEGLGWVMLDERRESDVFSPAHQLQTRIIMLSLIATLVAAALGAAVALSLSRRVEKVIEAASAIGQGELYTEVAVDGTDEVATLAREFNDMAAKLRVANQALIEARDEANAANQAKSAFLANMSHEIRTPLNGVMGMADLMSQTELNEEQVEYLKAIQTSADALLHLLNDILDFSKIEAGKMELESTPFHLADVVEQTAKTMRIRASAKGVELLCRIEPGLPEVLVGDPGRLRQIVVNLLGNAVKFTNEGQVLIDVSRSEREVGEQQLELLFQVHDTGIGIPPEKQAHIFDAFGQADASTTRQFGGTGLGLAISSQLVEMMGGEISVTSEAGQGATFQFSALFGIAPADQQAIVGDISSLAGLRVLIVDDNQVNCQIFEELLKSWHVESQTANDAQSGLELLSRAVKASQPIHLVLLDYMMPHMDGFEFAQRVRHDEELSKTEIIMVSSATMPGHTQRCEELQIRRYLSKPVVRSELFEAIAAITSQGNIKLQQDHKASAAANQKRTLRILLAEDGLVNQKVAVGLLSKLGHQVEVVCDGQQAVDAYRNGTYDLVFMDVQMPEVDGYAATAAIREYEQAFGKRTPIIAMTANAMQGDREKCIEAGMDDYVAKPIQRDKLYATVERHAPPA